MINRFDDQPGLSEQEAQDRRSFVRKALPFAAALAAPAWLPQVSYGRQTQPRDVLVHVFLRGGMDGLTTCVPHGDPAYYDARPSLAIPRPGHSGGAIDLDGFFGLPPSAASLKPIFEAKDLAFVHAVGAPGNNFSHFDAEKRMERGYAIKDGWLARHMRNVDPWGNGLFRGASATVNLPETFKGAPASLSIRNFENAGLFPGDPQTQARRRPVLEFLFEDAPEDFRIGALNTMSTIDILADIDFANYAPENGAVYSDTTFGTNMRGTAALIKADVGVEAVMANFGGWDLHADLGPHNGSMAELLSELCDNLLAFYMDMQGSMERLTVLVFSEFGRRVAENGSGGADHGHGNCMIAYGGGIRGGHIYGDWPGLDPGQLDRGNLAMTTDYRDIVAEILEKRLASPDLRNIFPEYSPVYRGIAK